MVTPDHLCPWGIKAKDLLNRSGYEVEDHHLETMKENEAYKKENGYDETPQIFIDGDHLGGYDELREALGKGPDPKEGKSYQPIIAVFAVTLLMALSATYASLGALPAIRVLELFIAFSMCVLGILKLQDLKSYATGFVQYDLLARRWVPYGKVYPFGEAAAGILMLSGSLVWLSAPIALLIGTVGAVSVFKAVYIDRRELKCACVGGDSKVPLGFVSLTENLMMVAMGLWMPIKAFLL